MTFAVEAIGARARIFPGWSTRELETRGQHVREKHPPATGTQHTLRCSSHSLCHSPFICHRPLSTTFCRNRGQRSIERGGCPQIRYRSCGLGGADRTPMASCCWATMVVPANFEPGVGDGVLLEKSCCRKREFFTFLLSSYFPRPLFPPFFLYPVVATNTGPLMALLGA